MKEFLEESARLSDLVLIGGLSSHAHGWRVWRGTPGQPLRGRKKRIGKSLFTQGILWPSTEEAFVRRMRFTKLLRDGLKLVPVGKRGNLNGGGERCYSARRIVVSF